MFSEPIKGNTGSVEVDFGGGDDGGKGYEGGGEDDEVVKKVGMSMSQKLTLGYAALVGCKLACHHIQPFYYYCNF